MLIEDISYYVIWWTGAGLSIAFNLNDHIKQCPLNAI